MQDKEYFRSQSGFLIYVDAALVLWYSKKSSTAVTSVFKAKFVVMKQGKDTIRGLRHKLIMMGISISGFSYIYGDNMSGKNNTSKPESVIKNKSNSVYYHTVHELVAMGECLVVHIHGSENVAGKVKKLWADMEIFVE